MSSHLMFHAETCPIPTDNYGTYISEHFRRWCKRETPTGKKIPCRRVLSDRCPYVNGTTQMDMEEMTLVWGLTCTFANLQTIRFQSGLNRRTVARMQDMA